MFDSFCAQIAKKIPVDLVPGEHDPSDASFPQRPLHKAYFPRTLKSTQVELASNPHRFELQECDVLATSGLNINKLKKYCIDSDLGEQTSLDLMRATLEWQHLCPIAPDTIW